MCCVIGFPVFGQNYPEEKIPPPVWNKPMLIRFITSQARKYKVRPAVALAIAEIESSFNVQALRWERHLRTASVGVFQVLHTTAQAEFGFEGSIEDLKDPNVNVPMGLKYISRCEPDLKSISCCYQAGFYADVDFCERHPGVQTYLHRLKQKVAEWDERLAI